MNKPTPRGIRNNNPLNIRKGATWLGLSPTQDDAAFCQFRSMELGIRAACKIIQTYIRKHHLTTVREIIYRWAPPADGNDTGAYVRQVCKRAYFFPETCIHADDALELTRLLEAMAYVENGIEIDHQVVFNGVMLALG